MYVEGDVEPLSRGGTFVAQHIATSLRGVVVQVNTFHSRSGAAAIRRAFMPVAHVDAIVEAVSARQAGSRSATPLP